jgi:manganese/zinc/iron transport system substrate-binding protein
MTSGHRSFALFVAPLFASIVALFVSGCESASQDFSKRKIRVTTTVGMVADMVKNVGADRVEVISLMGPGVDPHLYKASEGDIARLSGADIVFYNGLVLEGKMTEIFQKIRERGKPTIPIGESLDPSLLRTPPEFKGHHDPHVWFDVSLWAKTIDAVVKGLSELDPPGSATYESNAAAYRAQLETLHQECRQNLATIPKEGRVLVTAHDAFGYFGRAYDVEVVGLQGISTSSEYGLRDVQRLVDLIAERKIKAVFVESSVPTRSIEAVVEGCRAKGWNVKIGGQLFSDAMGAGGTPEGTYIGMVRHNVHVIVEALK